MITVLSSASARPNFVKLTAVHHALAKHSEKFKHVIVHTGQHYDPLLSDVFFKQLHIPDPDYNLGVKGGADREAVIAATAEAMEPILRKEKPDIVLVYGDVNGAVGAARAAKKLRIKIGHVEAGLRSGDLGMPEEHNRIEIDQLSDVLFTTENSAEENIRKEGLEGKIYFVGNTMIDSLIRMMPKIQNMPLPFDAAGEKFAIATIHRPSNVDNHEYFRSVMDFLGKIAQHIPIVFPTHPRSQKQLEYTDPTWNMSIVPKNVFSIAPLGYLEFIRQMKDAKFILTDSGGIQEEATFLGKRCFTLRRNTERPSTIESGSNILIDPENSAERKKVLEFAQNPKQIDVNIPEKWDGKAGERIITALRR